MDFWQRTEALLSSHKIVIARPRGSRHPRFPDLIYPLDYGYLESTTGSDGQEIDVWRGSLPGNHLSGVICTVDSLKNDAEVKLLVACTNTEINIVDRFYNDNDLMSGLVIARK